MLSDTLASGTHCVGSNPFFSSSSAGGDGVKSTGVGAASLGASSCMRRLRAGRSGAAAAPRTSAGCCSEKHEAVEASASTSKERSVIDEGY